MKAPRITLFSPPPSLRYIYYSPLSKSTPSLLVSIKHLTPEEANVLTPGNDIFYAATHRGN